MGGQWGRQGIGKTLMPRVWNVMEGSVLCFAPPQVIPRPPAGFTATYEARRRRRANRASRR